MGNLAERLQEEMEIKTAFTIPVFGGLEVKESVVTTWFIILGLFLLSLFLTKDMKTRNPGKRQIVAETIVTWLRGLVGGMVGEEGERYVTYLCSVLIYIGVANILGIFSVSPPTKDLRVTVALAVMSIVLIEAASFLAKGGKGFFKSFAEPVALVAPINVLELFIKPLSLCMRLFGNVFAAFVIMELVKMAVPVVLPAALCLYFDLFDGLIQAYVFVFLTSLYLKEAIE
ncbi:MAG: F0F1 ATP synthase subunit A [Lachnospiraceae bacterium]|nr:F0F1 ATP synthase subunit A [Lachnospiraceae bacterium]